MIVQGQFMRALNRKTKIFTNRNVYPKIIAEFRECITRVAKRGRERERKVEGMINKWWVRQYLDYYAPV